EQRIQRGIGESIRVQVKARRARALDRARTRQSQRPLPNNSRERGRQFLDTYLLLRESEVRGGNFKRGAKSTHLCMNSMQLGTSRGPCGGKSRPRSRHAEIHDG